MCAPHVAVEYVCVGDVDLVAIVGDVQAAGAVDVKHGMRAWLAVQAMQREVHPRTPPLIRRETSEAPEWPVQWTDGACTPEPSKPIWRGSKNQDLRDAHAETKGA